MKLDLRSFALLSTVLLAGSLTQAARAQSFHHLQGGDVFNLFFLDESRGWTAEDGGRIRYTSNGGEEWIDARTPDIVRGDLLGIFMRETGPGLPVEGWAVGANGVVLHSSNAGQDWVVINTSPLLDIYGAPATLNAVQFVDADNGWTVGFDEAVHYTTNGGTSWTQLDVDVINHGTDLYDVHFFDAGHGIIVGDYGLYARTANRGLSWTHGVVAAPCGAEPPCESNLELWSLDFFDDNRGYLVGGRATNDGFIFRTDDGGTSWQPEACFQLDPFVTCDAPGGCGDGNDVPTQYGLTAVTADRALSVGYAASAYVRKPPTGAPLTAPCGSSACQPVQPYIWDKVGETELFANPPFNAAADAGNHLWIGGAFNLIRRTTNVGDDWTDQAGTHHIRMIDGTFTSESVGFLVGQGKTIARTLDGGGHYDLVKDYDRANCGAYLFGIAFDSIGNNGIAVGQGNAEGQGDNAVYTLTSGATWWPIDLGPNVIFRDVAIASNGSVLAVGNSGKVVSAPAVSGPFSAPSTIVSGVVAPTLHGVCFRSPQEAFAVGRTFFNQVAIRRAYRTTNPPGNWSPLQFVGGTSSITINDVAARGQEVWAVGDNAEVYKLNSASSTFELQPLTGLASPPTAKLNGLALPPDSLDVFAVGEDGLVLRFDAELQLWSSLKSRTTHPLHAATFFSESSGYVMGVRFGVLGWWD